MITRREENLETISKQQTPDEKFKKGLIKTAIIGGGALVGGIAAGTATGGIGALPAASAAAAANLSEKIATPVADVPHEFGVK